MSDIKITSRILGGLGNQMFAVACGLAHAWKHNYKVFFQKDTTHISKQHSKVGYFENVFKDLPYEPDIDISTFQIYQEPDQTNTNEIPEFTTNTILVGYYQSDFYFKEYEPIIKKLFKIDVENFYRLNYPNKKLIAIHIRRGDYVDLDWVLDMQYYLKAVEYFKEKYPDCVFIVFTNDEVWCKVHLPWEWVVHKSIEDYKDMMLMSEMDGLIIANSTFSWWAAFLSENSEIVSPKTWYYCANKNISRKDWIVM